MIIWGWRRYAQTIAMITFVCGHCGNPAAQTLRKLVTKFTLFFVPLFPVHRRFEVQCTFCGATGKVTKEQAEAMRAQSQGPAAPQQQPPMQFPQGGQVGQVGQPGQVPQQYAPQQYPQAPAPQVPVPQAPAPMEQPPMERTAQLPMPPYEPGQQPGHPGQQFGQPG